MIRSELLLLDTNTVSYIMNGRSQAVRNEYAMAVRRSEIAISAISKAEVLFGLRKRPQAVRLRAAFEHFSEHTRVLPWDETVADSYALLRADLERSGNRLELIDLLIASHAIASGAALVTSDKAFQRAIPALNIQNWATDL